MGWGWGCEHRGLVVLRFCVYVGGVGTLRGLFVFFPFTRAKSGLRRL
jgi:hypothetical protein